MQRNRHKYRQLEHSTIGNALSQNKTVIETNPETLNKLMSGETYNKKDIEDCAKHIFASVHFKYDYKIIDYTKSLSLENCNPNEAYTFILYEERRDKWVVACLCFYQNNLYVLYKNSTGETIDTEMEQEILKKFPSAIIKINKKNDQEGTNPNAPLCLRNLYIITQKIEENFLKFLKEDFETLQFFRESDLNLIKIDILYKNTLELADKEEFKKQLQDFFENIPIDIADDAKNYQKILEEEILKENEDEIDLQRIEAARKQLIQSEKLNSLKENVEIDNDMKTIELKIKTTFPAEVEKLQEIFRLLNKMKHDQNFDNALQIIANILGIEYNKLKQFYDINLITPKKESSYDKIECLDISKIQLPDQKTVKPQNDISSLEELLYKLTLGVDAEHNPTYFQKPTNLSIEEYKKQYSNNPEKLHLEELINMVKNYYDNWQNSDIKMINAWAKSKRDKLGNTEQEICEAIAIMDRAFNLTTGKFRLRDAQILSTLIFLFNKNTNEGRLSQIETGEGKTLIVFLLATIKVLQGSKVDVITSNSVLATEGLKETKTLFHIFGITVSTNNVGDEGKADIKAECGQVLNNEYKSEKNNRMLAYTADVLYGTISNFQFDFLRDTVDGRKIRHNRKFDVVILDEVDSMLIDNGSHIAKLTNPFPGMENLRYIYIKIWQVLHKSETEFYENSREVLLNKILELKKIYNEGKKPKEVIRKAYEDFLIAQLNSQQEQLTKKIKESLKQIKIDLIPPHLTKYVDSKIDVWIKNAIYAKYYCNEFEQYRLVKHHLTNELVVMPVDYQNTGITMKNTIWSHGLHQFIQLKHNLHLTYESLTSSFISNIGYIKNYPQQNIFGMTGTLGSKAEQTLLSTIYNVDYAKIPPYKPKLFTELPNKVVDDDEWSRIICLEVLEKIDEGRAVLLICENESDLKMVKDDLKILSGAGEKFNFKIYAHEEDVNVTCTKVAPGDIIISTNIAGRGTNFKTTEKLEAKGGLHVCVGFLPYNQRVESQAYGRTARQGYTGTAQLIMRKSEILELGFTENDLNNINDFTVLKTIRDVFEQKRLDKIRLELLKELNFKDEIFSYFAKLHRKLILRANEKYQQIILKDLKEYWAFWLDKKNYNIANIKNTTPKVEFEQFKNDANTILNKNEIQHNPFYLIELAQYYMEDHNDSKTAKKYLQKAINFHDHNFVLLYGAHSKLFEVAMESEDVLRTRLKKAIKQLIFMNVSNNENYKKEALQFLQNAQFGIRKELDFIQSEFGFNQDGNIEPNPNFYKIIEETKTRENYFLKHLFSRFSCLVIYKENIDDLIKKIEVSELNGVTINDKFAEYLEILNKENHSELFGKDEIVELGALGINTIYSVKIVYDISSTIIIGAQIQIGLGLVALASGIFFPPIFPIMASIAGTLISEAILDLVFELLSNGDEPLNTKDYIKGKFISYGISLLTFGVGAIVNCTKIIDKALSFCRKLSGLLRKSKYLKPLCEIMAKTIDKFGYILQNTLDKIRFKQLSKVNQLNELRKLQISNPIQFESFGGIKRMNQLNKLTRNGVLKEPTRKILFYTGIKHIAIVTGKRFAIRLLFKKKVVDPVIMENLQIILSDLCENVKSKILEQMDNNRLLKEKIQKTEEELIYKIVANYLGKNLVTEIAKSVAYRLLGELDNIAIVIITFKTEEISLEMVNKVKDFSVYLENHLQENNADNNINELFEKISTKITDRIYELITETIDSELSLTENILKRGGKKINKKPIQDDNRGDSQSNSNQNQINNNGDIENHNDDENENTNANTKNNKNYSNQNNETDELNEAYNILGLSSGASDADILRRYRSLSLQLYPRNNLDDQFAWENLHKVSKAYYNIISYRTNTI